MEHANYGGHYVISAENVAGEYFIALDSENTKEELKYIISYHLYNKNEKTPYKLYGISSSQIKYKYSLGGVEFTMSRVTRKDNGPMIGSIVYKLYISNNTEAI
jgi:hypothetical protein